MQHITRHEGRTIEPQNRKPRRFTYSDYGARSKEVKKQFLAPGAIGST
jgi:hypothetical protein